MSIVIDVKINNAIADGKPYSLVTIDVGLPGIGGLELLRNFHAAEQKGGGWPSKKIMITANSHAETVVEAVKGKCDAYLVKPVEPTVLAEKLKKMDIHPISK